MQKRHDFFVTRLVKRCCMVLAIPAALMIVAGQALAAPITIVNEVGGFLGSTKTQVTTTHNGTTQISYDATGIDKLVVVFATESGFNNNTVTSMTMKFNNVR